MSYLQDLVYRRSAIVLHDDKSYLIATRLAPLVREVGLKSIDELVGKIRHQDASAPLVRRVIEAMTTNETLFFRDLHPFEALRTRILPDLIRARSGQRALRIWCAAASTGQEPYSIAMTLREHFPELATWDVKIVASDINASVLARARAATYRQVEVNRGLPVTMLFKYFERQGTDWALKPAIKDVVEFVELNLLDAWTSIGPQDVVFIRNVLIYFDVETKRQLLRRIRGLLRGDGFLVLGGAETTNNIDENYAPVKIGSGVYYQVRPPPPAAR
ncbi:MAG TPA: protein-glutamate O-methyltransferase CheR [Polyangiaceae bacterium]|nr:protein-glutamate O-methyltransferase CheR [Polyangiaceae bacterium]